MPWTKLVEPSQWRAKHDSTNQHSTNLAPVLVLPHLLVDAKGQDHHVEEVEVAQEVLLEVVVVVVAVEVEMTVDGSVSTSATLVAVEPAPPPCSATLLSQPCLASRSRTAVERW